MRGGLFMAKRLKKEREFRSIEEFKREVFQATMHGNKKSAPQVGTGLATEIFARIRKKKTK